MASDIFFVSDPHLFHNNILKFTDTSGARVRPSFDTIDQMHEALLENHNAVVKPTDKVYFMGDISFKYGAAFDELFPKFNGRKRLIPGNHDDIKRIANHFEKISVWRVFNEKGIIPFTVTHIPIEKESIKGKFNVHGHTHQNLVSGPEYVNLCVEHTNYKPVHWDELQQILRTRLLEWQLHV